MSSTKTADNNKSHARSLIEIDYNNMSIHDF